MIALPFIAYALKTFKAGQGPEVLTVRRFCGYAGINYRDIRMLERTRVISPAFRDEKRRLLWERAQAIDALERILHYCEVKEELRCDGKRYRWIDVIEVLMNEGKLYPSQEDLSG